MPTEYDKRPCSRKGCDGTQTYRTNASPPGSQAGVSTTSGKIAWVSEEQRQPGWNCSKVRSILIRPEKSRMTRYLFLVLLVVMPIGGSTQQKSEPSPTVEQCRSDIDSWLADRWNTSRLSFLKIQARTVELGACGATYHQLLRWREENPSDTSPGKTSDFGGSRIDLRRRDQPAVLILH